MSLGPVSVLEDSKLLMPSMRRAILPHELAERYGRQECGSDVSDTDAEPEIITRRFGCLRDKSKKLKHNRRITFHSELVAHYYPDTIYFGYEPSVYTTRNDYYKVFPSSIKGRTEERVDLGAMPRLNDSHIQIPDTKRRYEAELAFGRAGIWNLARAVAQARAI